MFYYLFMYGVGLRVGPSFVNSLGGDGLKFTLLAVVSCVIGLVLVVLGRQAASDLPPGAAGGILAGSQTMSAAIGSAEEAVNAGVRRRCRRARRPEQVSSMIALSYGITYIWGTVGIILITKYLPKWWGIDAKAAAARVRGGARRRQRRHADADAAGRPAALRAYRLENADWVGKTVGDLLHGQSRIPDRQRGARRRARWPSPTTSRLQPGDVIALGGRRETMTEKMGLIGPEVSDRVALDIPLDRAEILVTNKDVLKLTQRGAARAARRRPDPGRQARARRRRRSRSAPTPSCSAWTSSPSSA